MPARKIDIVTRFNTLAGGTEWRALCLYDWLAPRAEVEIWNDGGGLAQAPARYRIQSIDLTEGRYPRGSTLVVIGAFWNSGQWLERTTANRCVLIYNTYSPLRLNSLLARLRTAGIKRLDLVYASLILKAMTELPGVVQASPIHLEDFQPAPKRAGGPFIVGRLSRDVPEKHHPEDVSLYTKLVENGCHVRIMGGVRSLHPLSGTPSVELLAECSVAPAEFLRSLDCFYFRTDPRWLEACSRTVLEAMASALPVVCDRQGGHTELIEHGRNGFVFTRTEEALAIILNLKANAVLRETAGVAAHTTVLDHYSEQRQKEWVDFYLS